MRNIRKLKENVQKFGLIFIIVLLFSFPYLNKTSLFKDFHAVQLLGLVTAMFTWIYLDLDKKLNEMIRYSLTENQFFLSDAIRFSFDKKKKINHLRIIASTSETIQSIIRGAVNEKVYIKKCSLIIRYATANRLSKEQKSLNKHIDNTVKKWEVMKRQGIIGELEIINYDFEPFSYAIFFDESIAIQGLSRKSDETVSGLVTDLQVTLITDNVHSKKKISNLIDWFDDLVVNINKKEKAGTNNT